MSWVKRLVALRPFQQTAGIMAAEYLRLVWKTTRFVVEPEGIQIVSKGSDEAKQRRYYDLSYIVSDDEEFMKVQDSISILEDVKAVKVGSMLVVTAEEKQHLEIEELLSRIAQMPKENL